jgi:RimJ/RimL family protein N-acetyltransferase
MSTISLDTPRLLLRPPQPSDFPRYAEFAGDPVSAEHLGGIQHEADAWRSFASLLGAWQLTPAAMFSVIERASGQWIGRVGPWTPHLWPVKEVGWGIHRSAEGQGFAFEAAIASLDYAFEVLGWDRVDHLIADENSRSRALAERLGSTPGEMKTMPGSMAKHPVRAWGQTRDHWLAHRAVFDELVPR